MHNGIITIEAENHFDLGLKQGKIFSKSVIALIEKQKNWVSLKTNAARLIDSHFKVFPQYMEELHGFAKGAEIPLLDLFTLAIEDDAESTEVENAKCTTLYSFDKKLIGFNEDVTFNEGSDEICLLTKKINGLSTFEIYYIGTIGGSSFGINSNGHIISVNTLLPSEVNTFGISKAFISRAILDAQNPCDEFSQLAKLQRKSGYNYNVFKQNEACYHFEFNIFDPYFSYIKEDYIHTNHCLKDCKLQHGEDPAGTRTRYEYGKKLLKDVNNVDDMKNVLLDDSKGIDKSINNKNTIASVVADLTNNILYIKMKSRESIGWERFDMKELLAV